MNKTKKLILKRPLIFSFGMIVLFVAATSIPLSNLFGGICEEQAAEYITGIIEQTLASVILILLLKKLDLFENAGFKRKSKELWIIWPMILFILFNGSDFLAGSIVIDTSKPFLIVLFVLVFLSTGLFEEILCRGLVFGLMANKWGKSKSGCYLAVLVSSLLFGLSHFVQFMLGHESLLANATQIIYASFIGVFFCACLIRNQSIYPAIILHGILDMSGSLKEIAVNGGIDKGFRTISVEGAMICVIIALPLFVYALFILRNGFGKSAASKENE